MPAERRRVAIFESTTLLAKEIRSLMETRGLADVDVKLFDTKDDGVITEFGGEAMIVVAPDEDAMVGVDVALLCGSAAQTSPFLDWPSRKRYVAIDLSGASASLREAPLIHCDVNAVVLGEARQLPPLIASPHPVAHNLASVTAVARAVAPVAHVEALALRPASEMGAAGVDELYQQTVALLSFSSVPQETFGRQIAFNVLPSSGVGPARAEAADERDAGETARLLSMQPGQVSVTSAFVPLFYGHALSVALAFERPPEIAELREAIVASRLLRLVEDPAAASPVDLASEEAISVSDLRPDPHRPGRVVLWTFCDNLKAGAALNAVRLAERVLDLRRIAS